MSGRLASKMLTLAPDCYGLPERTSRLRIVSEVVGRAVESSKDLTTAEASRVIDHLKPAEVVPDG